MRHATAPAHAVSAPGRAATAAGAAPEVLDVAHYGRATLLLRRLDDAVSHRTFSL